MNHKYHPLSQVIHWLTALLVVIAFVLGPEDVDELDNPSLDLGLQIHETLGLAVFGLTVFRIIWMLFSQIPLAVPMAAWMRVISKVLQGSLYLLLIAVPMTAILGTWLEGDALSLLNLTTIPSPFRTSENIGEFLLDLHPTLADILLILAGVHAAAALFHHFILKDLVLATMLPAWLSKKSSDD
jgi:cytochrome b561